MFSLISLAFAFSKVKRVLGLLWSWLCHRSFWQLVSLGLAVFVLVQHFELTRAHRATALWQSQFNAEKTAFDQTMANLRSARLKAKADDAANVQRVKAEQSAISERTANDFEARIADARARAGRLSRDAATHPGGGGATPVSGLLPAASGAAQASGENGLPAGDALTATEQAIQLDELIKWVRAQAAVDPNKGKPDG